jgi:hypothetical protein
MGGVIWFDETMARTTPYATPYTLLSASCTETRDWFAEKPEEASILLKPIALACVPGEELGRIPGRSGNRRSAVRSPSLRKPLQ